MADLERRKIESAAQHAKQTAKIKAVSITPAKKLIITNTSKNIIQ